MFSSAYVWAKVLNYLEDRLGASAVSNWFDDAEVVELNEVHLILYIPDEFRQSIVRTRCANYIEDALKDIFQSNATLVVYNKEELDKFRQKDKTVSSMEFNPQFNFENFVVGPSNRFVYNAALAVADNPGQNYNPLFIYGPPGLGKTHLLHAIANSIHQQNPDTKIVNIKGEQFTIELMDAIRIVFMDPASNSVYATAQENQSK